MPYRNYGYHPEEVRAFPVPVVSMWHRFWAYMIDVILLYIISIVLLGLGFWITVDQTPTLSWEQRLRQLNTIMLNPTMLVLNATSIVIAIIYYVGCWTMGGQTLGKMILGIRVVNDSAQPPSLASALLRYLGFFINNIFSIGFLAIAFDKRKQGWHDKMGHTFVIPADVEVPLGMEPVFLYPHDSNTADTIGVFLYIFSVCILPFIIVLGLILFAPPGLTPDLG